MIQKWFAEFCCAPSVTDAERFVRPIQVATSTIEKFTMVTLDYLRLIVHENVEVQNTELNLIQQIPP